MNEHREFPRIINEPVPDSERPFVPDSGRRNTEEHFHKDEHKEPYFTQVVETPKPGVNVNQNIPFIDNNFSLTLKRYILLELGYPNVEVELCDEQLDMTISDTCEEFLRFNTLNLVRYWRMPLENGVCEYDLPRDLRVVRDVVTFKLSQFDVIFGADIIINPIYLRNTRDAYQDILTYWLSEAAFETQKRVYGLETSWDVVEGNTRIRLYPTPSSDRMAIIKGSYQPKPGTIDERAVGTKYELFRRCCVARSMIILGRVRGKRVSGINTSQGTVMLDGEQMKAEGKEILTEARTELQATGRPLGFYKG